MMLVKTFGSAVYGVEAITITIEVTVGEGTGTWLTGLPDVAIKESLWRVESSIKEHQYYMPRNKVVINLAPADIRKSGASFDLPMAIAILGASMQLRSSTRLNEYVIMGELGLDGTIHPIRGALTMAITARREGFRGIILPKQNAREAAMVNNIEVRGAENLAEVVQFLRNGEAITPTVVHTREEFFAAQDEFDIDFNEVKGQENIKRALEIAAAGGHNAVLIGPPGAGKTMLARRLPTILPPLTLQEALETTRIHSVAGKLPANATLISKRPFRSPHHTLSDAALVGGGSLPQPGEISLAHNGVLFLDELPEFKRSALEVMRQPMEERKVIVARARITLEFPASFMLIASMNPCPCGFYNHPDKECTCLPGIVQKYLNKVSGPMLDRIDLHVEVTPVAFSDLSGSYRTENSTQIRNRVIAARDVQLLRFEQHENIFCNAQMPAKLLEIYCVLDTVGHNLLKIAMSRLNLSARAYDRILKVARTIADLAAHESVMAEDIAEAIQYRSLDPRGLGAEIIYDRLNHPLSWRLILFLARRPPS